MSCATWSRRRRSSPWMKPASASAARRSGCTSPRPCGSPSTGSRPGAAACWRTSPALSCMTTGSRTTTRVTGFLWDRGRDRLWRQGIDLIGDNRGRDVGESVEDGTMFGKSEGGEFLDMTDDGFDDVAPIEQSLVEERHR